jgi:hypothetical protein
VRFYCSLRRGRFFYRYGEAKLNPSSAASTLPSAKRLPIS